MTKLRAVPMPAPEPEERPQAGLADRPPRRHEQSGKATFAGEDEHAACRAAGQVLDRIGDKWTVMAVGALSKGPMRFNAMMRTIGGVSHRMLTLTLRGLERDGLVTRTAYPTIPPKVEYELTELGRSLIEPLTTLATWAQRHQPAIEAARVQFDGNADPA